jgi:phosphatidylglycerophosphatase A
VPTDRRGSLARLVAGGFGTGFAPVAAGTVASAVAVLIGGALLYVSPWLLAAAALAATAGGYVAIRAARVPGDPGWIVIDEFAGQWITLLGLSQVNPWGLLVAFLLFRFFDVTKLGPVGWADRKHGPAGVMADDVIAGMIAAAILLVARLAWARFGW